MVAILEGGSSVGDGAGKVAVSGIDVSVGASIVEDAGGSMVSVGAETSCFWQASRKIINNNKVTKGRYFMRTSYHVNLTPSILISTPIISLSQRIPMTIDLLLT